MSNLGEHLAEQAALTALCEAGTCNHPDCKGIDWYERRDELRADMVFRTYDGSLVKLDRRVPGDGTKWYVAEWSWGSWGYYDSTVEPGDLTSQEADPEGKK